MGKLIQSRPRQREDGRRRFRSIDNRSNKSNNNNNNNNNNNSRNSYSIAVNNKYVVKSSGKSGSCRSSQPSSNHSNQQQSTATSSSNSNSHQHRLYLTVRSTSPTSRMSTRSTRRRCSPSTVMASTSTLNLLQISSTNGSFSA